MKCFLLQLTIIMLLLFCVGFSPKQQQSLASQNISFDWVTMGDLHLMLVPLRIGSDRPRLFIVDTGMPNTNLDRSLAASLHLNIKTYVFDEQEKVDYITSPVTLGVQALALPNVPFVLLDMTVAHEAYPNVAGILGLNFLDNFALRLDFSKQRLDLLLPGNVKGGANQPKGAEGIPLLREKDKYYVNGTLDGNPIKFLIDTGTEHTFVSNRSVLASLKPQHTLEGQTAAVASDSGTSLQVVPIRKMRLRTLAIGKITWDHPIVEQHLSTSKFDTNGLGMDFWRRCVTLIDFPGRMLYLSADPTFSAREDAWIGSGMILAKTPENHWTVTTVFSPSPAKEAKIEEGDEIVTFLGKQTQGLTDEEMLEIIQHTETENAEVTGTARRKGSQVEYKFRFFSRKLL